MIKDEKNNDLEVVEDEELDVDFDDLEEDEGRNQPESRVDWRSKTKKFQAIANRKSDKVKALEEEIEALKNPKQEDKPVEKTDEEPDAFTTMKAVAMVTKELGSDELEELELQAKSLGVDPVKFAGTPVWKAHLDAFRSNNTEKQKTPSPSSRTRVIKSKEFADTLADDKASPADKQSAFEKARDGALGKKEE